MLAYYVIWKWEVGISREELDGACEYLLQKGFGVELDFQGEEKKFTQSLCVFYD